MTAPPPDEPPAEGWYADPYGRHGARWISAGTPTALVRDGERESQDPPPSDAVAGPLEPLPEPDEGAVGLVRADEAERDGSLGGLRRADDAERADASMGVIREEEGEVPEAWSAGTD